MSKFAGLAVQADKPSRMTVRHPGTGQPLRDKDGNEAWIDLLSADSAAGLRQQRAIRDRRLAGHARRLKAEDMDREGAELLAALTTGWSLVALDGAPIDVPCNAGNAAELYSIPELLWLREQVDQYVADRGNFLAS